MRIMKIAWIHYANIKWNPFKITLFFKRCHISTTWTSEKTWALLPNRLMPRTCNITIVYCILKCTESRSWTLSRAHATERSHTTHISFVICANKSLLAACHSIGWRACEQANEIFVFLSLSFSLSLSFALLRSGSLSKLETERVSARRKQRLKQGPKVKSHFYLHCSAFRDKNKWDKHNSETRTPPNTWLAIVFLLFWSCCSLFAISLHMR